MLFVRCEEGSAQFRVRSKWDLAKETLIIQEKVGGQDVLPVTFLKQIARGFRGASKRIVRVGLLPSVEMGASVQKL